MDNDLISREALRNEIDTWGCNDYDKYDFLEAIDKAPTVEPDCLHCKQYQGGYDYGFNIGYNKGKKERPQGEWKRHDEWVSGDYVGGFYHVNCPVKDGLFVKWPMKYCGNCGAPMQLNDKEEGGAE